MAGPTPTDLTLEVRAEYEKEGDTVLVSCYVIDRALELGFPGLVKAGTCLLLYKGNPIRSIPFDKRFGNGAEGLGDFIFQFSRPPAISDLQVQVDIELHPYGATNQMSRTVPVTHSTDPYIPLDGQIGTGPGMNEELRSVKRVNEELL